MENKKYVYYFGGSKAEGKASMKQLLGGKGANLHEMVNMGIPVPPGFTISTEVCNIHRDTKGKLTESIRQQVYEALKKVEEDVGRKFGDSSLPLLLSVRSGAAVSMPGMMDTVLNLGLNDGAVEGMCRATNNEPFVWDCYRRFITMYSDVVRGIHRGPYEAALTNEKKRLGVKQDCDLKVDSLKRLVTVYKGLYKKATGEDFPQDPMVQLFAATDAVFGSWFNNRAIKYREMFRITGLLGTAVNVQAMVFGNMSNTSGTGVAFSRNPANGDPDFYGEYLINAQGEDVVAGVRTPQQIRKAVSITWASEHGVPEDVRVNEFPSMEESMPENFKRLVEIRNTLEKHFRDMQDMEFTMENGKLWLLQTRNGKRTMLAATRIAVQMVNEGLITEKEAVMRIDPNAIDQLLHPMIDTSMVASLPPKIAKGLAASPGAAVGQIVFEPAHAVEYKAKGLDVILVREETSPEDLVGMTAAVAILTARGGTTSHAAVVARGMGKTCVCGCGDLHIDHAKGTMTVQGKVYREGDWLTVDGTKGIVYDGKAKLIKTGIKGDFQTILGYAKKYKTLKVRCNADTPADAATAFAFGAEGVGLCRTEHMFFESNRIDAMREMILAKELNGRQKALDKMLPYQRSDFMGIFREMKGLPCTIRLLDPPLHEFLPNELPAQKDLANKLGVTVASIANRVKELHEVNPMLGHRGVRLGITFPEIYNTQVRAIMEAAAALSRSGLDVEPEIMIPLVGKSEELCFSRKECIKVCEDIIKETGVSIRYSVGTMIEVPRAAVTADELAVNAEFFSFGTNDLTQMGCGFSRDDSASFLKHYVANGIYDRDPFESIDQKGVGLLVQIAVEKGRAVRPGMKIGVCGEHGGDSDSIDFFHRAGLTYVSCSPYRVPTAIVAAAHAAIKHGPGQMEGAGTLKSTSKL